MAKPKSSSSQVRREPYEPLELLHGADQLRFAGDIAFDIETAPQHADHEEGALLNPETARVAAIGYYEPLLLRTVIATDDDEQALLRQFWDLFRIMNAAGFKMLGFNCYGFDLPFLVRRSWQCGVPVPRNIMTPGGRYWCDTFIDLMVVWRCGSYREFISLDALARFLKVGEKKGNGALFYRLWQTDNKAAIEYLSNDVLLTYRCARQMGVVTN